MGKYTVLGFLLALILLTITGLVINHSSNTANMQQIDAGIETAVLGEMRSNSDYGMRAKDVVAVITDEVSKNQTKNKKVVVIDYKFYSDEDGKAQMNYDNAISDNSLVKSVQYRVRLYSNDDLGDDYKLKSGAKPESTTINRIVLGKQS